MKYFITAIKLFFLQTILEVVLIIILLYFGIPFFEMNVGNEHFYEIIIGVLGFYALTKCIYYGLIYLIAFIFFSYVFKIENKFRYSILNGILSVFYIVLFIINGRNFGWVLNPVISSIIVLLSIIFYSKKKPHRSCANPFA